MREEEAGTDVVPVLKPRLIKKGAESKSCAPAPSEVAEHQGSVQATRCAASCTRRAAAGE